MPRYIDADALQRELEKSPYNDYDDYLRTERLIDDAPTVEQSPVIGEVISFVERDSRPKGKWVVYKDNYGNDKPVCSCCNKEQVGYANYCSYCGADMRSAQNLNYADNDTAQGGLASAT